MTSKPLTARQQQVLNFIRQYLAENKMPPVAREVAEAIGCRSKNSAVLHLQALQRKGVINIRPGTARGIVLVDSVPVHSSVCKGHSLVIPDELEIHDDFDSAFEHGKAVGWNEYRAAMLKIMRTGGATS